MVTYTLKVVEIRKETEDSLTLCFKQPGLKKVKYQAGQYLTLIFRINGRRYIRPYSFSSAPAVDSLLEVTIKRILNGVVSNHIHDTVRVGDSIEVMQPMGDFVCEDTHGEILLWGVGSGITPLISIAKQLLTLHLDVKVNLIYGNRNCETTIFFGKIQELQKLYQKRFLVKHFHSQFKVNPNIPSLIEGRITQAQAVKIIEEINPLPSAKHFICGPAGLKTSVKTALKLKGFAEEQVFAEDFELVKDPKDFEDVNTQTIQLKFGHLQTELEVVKGKSILESALDAGIELPYSCQTGNCSTCKGKLIKGEAKMIGLTKQRDDLNVDEYLICCTHPLSSNVYIEIV